MSLVIIIISSQSKSPGECWTDKSRSLSVIIKYPSVTTVHLFYCTSNFCQLWVMVMAIPRRLKEQNAWKKGMTFEKSNFFLFLLLGYYTICFLNILLLFLSFPDLWREYRRKIISAHDILERLWRKSVKEQGKTFRNWCHQTKWLTTPKVLLFNLCTNIDKMISIFSREMHNFFTKKSGKYWRKYH